MSAMLSQITSGNRSDFFDRDAELLASLGGPDQAFYSAQPTETFTSELSAESVALLAVGYIYGGIWAPPPTGLSPVGTAASFAARAIVGFANFLLRLYESERPRAVLAGWDTLDVPTYRHRAFPAYQGG